MARAIAQDSLVAHGLDVCLLSGLRPVRAERSRRRESPLVKVPVDLVRDNRCAFIDVRAEPRRSDRSNDAC